MKFHSRSGTRNYIQHYGGPGVHSEAGPQWVRSGSAAGPQSSRIASAVLPQSSRSGSAVFPRILLLLLFYFSE